MDVFQEEALRSLGVPRDNILVFEAAAHFFEQYFELFPVSLPLYSPRKLPQAS